MPNRINTQLRHYIYLQRLASGEIKNFSFILDELRRGILKRLPIDISDYSRTRFESELKLIESYQKEIYEKYLSDLEKSLDEIALSESNFERLALINSVSKSISILSAQEKKILTALKINPLSVGNNGAGKLLAPFIKDWSLSQISTVTGIIRQGWFEGHTIKQMSDGVKTVLSTQTKRTNEAIVRTSINHASQVARSEVWKANNDLIKGWRFVAVLDSRTTSECASIDSLNKIYELGEGPQPPRHINCRSTSIAVLDGEEPIDLESYYDWIKKQPRSFVLDNIGEGKGRLLLSGKLSAKEFAEFSLNNRFEPLTLTEMIEKDKRLNLGLFPKG